MLIFRRLKINHDSHEFILEFGTVTNKKFISETLQDILKIHLMIWVVCTHCTKNINLKLSKNVLSREN
jgi:hypothetical protein